MTPTRPHVSASFDGNDYTLPLLAGAETITLHLHVPTYSGGATFTISVEPYGDGDWVVTLPDAGEYDVVNGVVYLGGPDVEPPKRTWRTDLLEDR